MDIRNDSSDQKSIQTVAAYIGLSDYTIRCIIGILPHERKEPQWISVDLKVAVDITEALGEKDTSRTVDYVALGALIEHLAVTNSYYLLESFADDLLNVCFSQFPIHWGWVKVGKSGVVPGAKGAYVELEKERL